MEEDVMNLARKIMQDSPGMSPQQAIESARDIIVGYTEQGSGLPYQGQPRGPSFGALPGDRPQVSAGLLGPQEGMQPRPQPQGGMSPSACSQMGGSVQGGACVIPMMGQ
jgi:hypothetical protein